MTSLTKKITTIALSIVLFTALGCKKDNQEMDCIVGLGISVAFTDEATEISNAAIAYSNDPSTANCERYIKSVRDYISALKQYEDCAQQVGELAYYRETVQQAEIDLDELEENQCQ